MAVGVPAHIGGPVFLLLPGLLEPCMEPCCLAKLIPLTALAITAQGMNTEQGWLFTPA